MISDDFITHPHPDLQLVLIRKDLTSPIQSLDGKVYKLSSEEIFEEIGSSDTHLSVEEFLNTMCTPFGATKYLYK